MTDNGESDVKPEQTNKQLVELSNILTMLRRLQYTMYGISTFTENEFLLFAFVLRKTQFWKAKQAFNVESDHAIRINDFGSKTSRFITKPHKK